VEEAHRGAALRSQKTELETKHMEAEAKQRSAMRCLRAELVECEARCADAMAMREAEAMRRAMATEAQEAAAQPDLLANLDQLASSPREEREAGEEARDEAAEAGQSTAGTFNVEARRALRQMQARAENRLAEMEEQHAESLRLERERADMRISLADMRQEEAMRLAQEISDRRVAALEAQHMEALRDMQGVADHRVLEAEIRNTQLLRLLQNLNDAGLGGQPGQDQEEDSEVL